MKVGKVSPSPENQPSQREVEKIHSQEISAALSLTLKALLDGILTSLQKSDEAHKRGSETLRKSIDES